MGHVDLRQTHRGTFVDAAGRQRHLPHAAHDCKPTCRILFVDTGVLFDESLETRDQIAKEYGLEVVTLKPKQTMAEQTSSNGRAVPLGRRAGTMLPHAQSRNRCWKSRIDYDALIGSLRRSDGDKRAPCPILAIDRRNELPAHQPARQLHRRADAGLHPREQRHHQPAALSGLHDHRLQPLHDARYCPTSPNAPAAGGIWVRGRSTAASTRPTSTRRRRRRSSCRKISSTASSAARRTS